MTSSATRRKQRREAQRAALVAAQENPLADPVFGIDVAPWRGHGQYRLRVKWLVDRDPFHALMALTRLRKLHLSAVEQTLVTEARDAGVSWEDIGFALGVSGEAARKRLAQLVDELQAGDELEQGRPPNRRQV